MDRVTQEALAQPGGWGLVGAGDSAVPGGTHKGVGRGRCSWGRQLGRKAGGRKGAGQRQRQGDLLGLPLNSLFLCSSEPASTPWLENVLETLAFLSIQLHAPAGARLPGWATRSPWGSPIHASTDAFSLGF